MDIAGATKAASKLMLNPSFASSAPFITQKADWTVQLNGAYNLLFPYIHTDFPVRDEVIEYVVEKITNALVDHNSTNMHFGSYSTAGIDVPIMPTQITKATLEKIIIKNYMNSNGLTTFVIEAKSPTTPDDMVFDEIGYGV